MAATIESLVEKADSYLQPDKARLVREAYEFARACHEGQKRLSGEPYISHPLETALILSDLSLDADTLAAALLHDVIEDCGVSKEDLAAKFGAQVATLVDGVTKLAHLELHQGAVQAAVGKDGKRAGEHLQAQAESLRKMLVAMAQDIRVVLIKLADRLHNMRTLEAQPLERRVAIAQETLDIYAPLAHRLGIWDLKWQLEDLAFRHLQPEEYRHVARLLATKRAEREAYMDQACRQLQEALRQEGVTAEVYGRPKHLYSVYRKVQKYAELGKDFDEIYDLYALRVLVKPQADCYNALGVVHTRWRPMPGQFDDYIANPKANRYQALHTTVMGEGGTPFEVQIRTSEMHQVAEYGVAAHWRYKEGSAGKDPHFEEKMTWLRQLLEWQREVAGAGAEEFVESLKTDLFRDQVFVYTPGGDIKELPVGATPLDFAYLVHTDLGHRCIGAKVNGRLVSLDHQLQNGDTVEIMTSKLARGPSLDWLNPELGFLRTASAMGKARQWFRRQERAASLERGKDLLQRELRRLGLHHAEAEVARLLRYDNPETLLEELGNGTLGIGKVSSRLTAGEESAQIPTVKPTVEPTRTPRGIRVLGVGDLLTRIARCCSPLPGDEIAGYITRGAGVTVHRKSCPNIANEDEPERVVPVTWGPSKDMYAVTVGVAAWDRVGLLRDITTLVAAEGVNITSSLVETVPDGTALITLSLETTGIAQLRKLFTKLETVKGVTSVARAGAAAPAKTKGSGRG
ncbi:MAG: bifunctional (p)ppGpp synthetase/guanosine-3',5'-bis(diphosphate) 3'-pyrophosphohydrolase [Dehalococcoidia bacterium]|nr:bifunctional (p)ppGpp synthetase/guanosine-3',5'-bis(diphosphate) 3'-pyrophosphohydrolase [Dehalococcoidia bacterium]